MPRAKHEYLSSSSYYSSSSSSMARAIAALTLLPLHHDLSRRSRAGSLLLSIYIYLWSSSSPPYLHSTHTHTHKHDDTGLRKHEQTYRMHVKQNHARNLEQDASGSMSYHHHHSSSSLFPCGRFHHFTWGGCLFIIKGTELLVFCF